MGNACNFETEFQLDDVLYMLNTHEAVLDGIIYSM